MRDVEKSFRIGDWVVDPQSNLLHKGGVEVHLEPKAVDVLTYLARNEGTVVSTQELLDHVWSGRFVEDGAVYQSIAKLRSALGDKSGDIIETVPRRGYRIVAAVMPQPDDVSRTEPPKPTIGVAAFADLDDAAGTRTFASALHASIVSGLLADRLDCLVRKTNSAEPVDYRVEGDVHAYGDQIHVNVTLVRCSDGAHLYADRFVEPAGQSDSETRIVARIVGALAIHLDEGQRATMLATGTANADAYREYVAGISIAPDNQVASADASRAMIERFQAAVRLDPTFIQARLGIASRARALIQYSADDELSTHRALITDQFNAIQALEPDPEVRQEISMLVASVMHPELHSLEERIRLQLLNGNAYPDAHVDYGRILIGGRLYQEGIDYIDVYLRDHPESSAAEYKLAAHTGLLDLQEVVPMLERSLEKSPDVIANRTALIQILCALGEFRKAEAYLRQLREIDSDGIWSQSTELALRAVRGDIKAADLDDVLFDDDNFNFANGIVSFITGDIERGCEYWRTLHKRDMDIAFYWTPHVEVTFPETTLQHPRYQRLLDEIGIGQTWQRALAARVSELAPVTGIELRNSGSRRARLTAASDGG